jgi:hypothetical protein
VHKTAQRVQRQRVLQQGARDGLPVGPSSGQGHQRSTSDIAGLEGRVDGDSVEGGVGGFLRRNILHFPRPLAGDALDGPPWCGRDVPLTSLSFCGYHCYSLLPAEHGVTVCLRGRSMGVCRARAMRACNVWCAYDPANEVHAC